MIWDGEDNPGVRNPIVQARVAGTRTRHTPARDTRGLALGFFLVAMIVTWHSQLNAQQDEDIVAIGERAYFLPVPDKPASFELLGHDGTPFDNSALKGKWTFLFFGYTFCPDVCPTTLTVFREVRKQLDDEARDVQFVFVSVDPERDTLERLQQYVTYFDPTFRGVTGIASEISRLAESLGVVYGISSANHGGDPSGDYLMDHSSAILLTNPDGQMQGIFGVPHRATDIVEAFATIRDRAAAHSGSLLRGRIDRVQLDHVGGILARPVHPRRGKEHRHLESASRSSITFLSFVSPADM